MVNPTCAPLQVGQQCKAELQYYWLSTRASRTNLQSQISRKAGSLQGFSQGGVGVPGYTMYVFWGLEYMQMPAIDVFDEKRALHIEDASTRL